MLAYLVPEGNILDGVDQQIRSTHKACFDSVKRAKMIFLQNSLTGTLWKRSET